MRVLLFIISIFSALSFNSLKAQNSSLENRMAPFDLAFIWDISDSVGSTGIHNLDDLIFTGSEYWVNTVQNDDTIYSIGIDKKLKSTFKIDNIPGFASEKIRSMTSDGSSVFFSTQFYPSFAPSRIFTVDTSTKSWTSYIDLPSNILYPISILFDSTSNSGNGGFWIGESDSVIHLVDVNGNLTDSITLTNGLRVYGMAIDYQSFSNPHLILNAHDFNFNKKLIWVDIATKSITNNYYHTFDDNTSNTGGSNRSLFVANNIVLGSNLNYLIVLSSKGNLLESQVLAYELGIPPVRPAPINDTICNAIELNADSGAYIYDNINATIEVGEPAGTCFLTSLDNSVWFFIVPKSPAIRISSRTIPNPVMDSQISVYKSNSGCTGTLTQIACIDDGPMGVRADVIVNSLTIGDTIWIQVDAKKVPQYFPMEVLRNTSISRTFEAYDQGKFIALYDDEWTVAPGLNPGALGEDANVSALQAYAGNNSLHLFGQVNPVYQLGPVTTGMRKAGFQMYVPLGNSGYFSLFQNDSLSGNPISEIWFDDGGFGHSTLNNALFSFPQDAWFEVMFYADLDQDSLQFWVAGIPVAATKLSENGMVDQMGAFSFEPIMSNGFGSFFIDNMEYAPSLFPSIPNDSLSAFNLVSPFNGKKIATLNQNQNLEFIWNKSVFSTPSIVSYTLMIDEAGNDFSNPVYSSSSNVNGLDSLLTIDPLMIDSILSNQGLNVGDTFNAIWTVEAISNTIEKSAINGPYNVTFIRTLSVGLESLNSQQSINIYPNPAENTIYIDGLSNSHFAFEIMDILGRRILRNEQATGNQIDLGFLNKGIYLIRINNYPLQKLIIE